MAKDTVYEWIKVHAQFSDAVARARAARVLHLERKLLSSRKGAEMSATIFALRNAEPDDGATSSTLSFCRRIKTSIS